jgi:AhpD family alkylhydroperoxidase
MSTTRPVRYEQEIPDVMRAMAAVHEAIDAHGLDRTIHHLVQLRASQINRCAFCIKMHIREAREDGETSERLDRIVVWDQVSDFSEREKAALAWTEALTGLDPRTDLGGLRARLREHFSEGEIGALTATVAMINLWNRINVSRH